MKNRLPPDREKYPPLAFANARPFLDVLRANKQRLTRQQLLTLRGQALSGDLPGAYAGLERIKKTSIRRAYGEHATD